MRRVVRWPLRDALVAYSELAKKKATEAYRWEYLTWAAMSQSMKDPNKHRPKMPEILKESSDDGES
jgi:hypothetical protein